MKAFDSYGRLKRRAARAGKLADAPILDRATGIPYIQMQTIVETPAFQKSAAQAGMSEQKIAELIVYLAANPDAGDEIKGTGGCRKIRVAGRGKGKSGGYRVITFFSGPVVPLFLFYAYSKGDRDDLDGKQRNALRTVTKEIVETYGRQKPVRRTR